MPGPLRLLDRPAFATLTVESDRPERTTPVTPSSPLRLVVSGLAAGVIGGALHQSAAALVDPAYLQSATWSTVLAELQIGAVAGIALAFLYGRIPGGFAARAAAFALLMTLARFVPPLADPAADFTGTLFVRQLVLNGAFAIGCAFVLRQALELALPMANMPRRADEFHDDPAGAHGH